METMTGRRSVALTATAVFVLAAGLTAFAADQDFTLHNHTERTIESLTVSPTGTGQWSKDILGQDILDDHTDLVVRFPHDQSDCKWDVRVSFADGSTEQVSDVDLCSVGEVTFTR